MKSMKFVFMTILLTTWTCFFLGWATVVIHAGEPGDIPIFHKWSGDYPVVHLNRLPEDVRKSRVGYIGDAEVFAAVWQAFKPEETVPEVDFSRNLVVFSRNVDFYNRTSIFKITLKEGVADILAMETRSARPIEDNVAMAMAVIPRADVKFIQTGNQQIPVPTNN
jgi:hypothetical protein